MILETEKEVRLVIQTAVATALACWGYPLVALLLFILILPWQLIYRVAASLGGVVLEMKARRTVRHALRRMSEEPVEVT